MSKMMNIQRGKRERPLYVLLYGKEGIGKSTFGAGAPDPIFLQDPNDGEHLDINRFPKPETWADCLEAIDLLISGQVKAKSFVIDPLDWIEPLIWAHVCKVGKWEHIEEPGYGKGYTAAMDQWRILAARLDTLRDKQSMNIVLLAHAHIRTFKNPDGDDYDLHELKLNGKAAGLMRETPSAVLFAKYEVFVDVKKGEEKTRKGKAFGDGSRVMYTEQRPSFHAKNRYGLPFELPLSWAEFERAARKGAPSDAEELNKLLEELLAAADEKTRADGQGAVQRCAGDPQKLGMVLDWLRGKVQLSRPTA